MFVLFYSIAIFLLNHFVVGQVDEISKGNIAKRDQFPFFVEITILNTTVEDYMIMGCAGTLIQPSWILTAAHCFKKKNSLPSSMFDRNEIIAGITSGKTVTKRFILKVYIHSKYTYKNVVNSQYIEYDVALAKLKEPFKIKLPKKGIYLPDKKIPVCKAGIIIGRGIVRYTGRRNSALEFTSITSKVASQLTVSPEYPRNSTFYSEIYWHEDHPIVGDVGGPFLCYQKFKHFQYGIISSYYNNSLEQTAITEYESVVEYMDFIKQHVSLEYTHDESSKNNTKKRLISKKYMLSIIAASVDTLSCSISSCLFCIIFILNIII